MGRSDYCSSYSCKLTAIFTLLFTGLRKQIDYNTVTAITPRTGLPASLKTRQCHEKYQTSCVSEQLLFKMTFPFSVWFFFFFLRCHHKRAPAWPRSGEAVCMGSLSKPRPVPSPQPAGLTTATLKSYTKICQCGCSDKTKRSNSCQDKIPSQKNKWKTYLPLIFS